MHELALQAAGEALRPRVVVGSRPHGSPTGWSRAGPGPPGSPRRRTARHGRRGGSEPPAGCRRRGGIRRMATPTARPRDGRPSTSPWPRPRWREVRPGLPRSGYGRGRPAGPRGPGRSGQPGGRGGCPWCGTRRRRRDGEAALAHEPRDPPATDPGVHAGVAAGPPAAKVAAILSPTFRSSLAAGPDAATPATRHSVRAGKGRALGGEAVAHEATAPRAESRGAMEDLVLLLDPIHLHRGRASPTASAFRRAGPRPCRPRGARCATLGVGWVVSAEMVENRCP